MTDNPVDVAFIDDDPALRAANVQALMLAGLTVAGYGSALEALEVIDADFPGVVVTDIRMPRIDGLEAAARIRAGGGPSAGAPIIALTADAGEGERNRALLAGMDDFITKPIDAAHLLAVAARFTQRTHEQ